MTFAVCAERCEDSEQIKAMLQARLAELCADVELLSFCSLEALHAALSEAKITVLFLDADMTGMESYAAAKRIKAATPNCQIILFSASSARALAGYSVHPVGYLVKPINKRMLSETLDWCRQSWSCAMRHVQMTVKRSTVDLPIAVVSHVEVRGRELMIYGCRTVLTVTMSMNEFERRLGGPPFFRCHRSFLVNLYCVAGAERGVFRMTDGTEVPISPERAEPALAAYDALRRRNGQ